VASAGRRLAGGGPGLAGRVRRGRPGQREISAGLFICVKAASVRVPGIAGKLSVAGCGEAAAAACRPGLNEGCAHRVHQAPDVPGLV
jgi:hypothetical protein